MHINNNNILWIILFIFSTINFCSTWLYSAWI